MAREKVNFAAENKIRCDRQGGFLLTSMDRHTPGRPKLSRDATVTPKLDELGSGRDKASRCQKMAGIPEERFEEHIAAAEIKLRAERHMGKMLGEMEMNKGSQGTGSNQYNVVRSPDVSAPTGCSSPQRQRPVYRCLLRAWSALGKVLEVLIIPLL